MADGWQHVSLSDLATNPEKPGERWELSTELGIEAFNFNVAILEADDRLSQNHFHYHENQQELFFVVEGRCRVETTEEGFEMGVDEAVAFEKGEAGAHVIYNPFEEPCRVVAVGWPADGRYPVHQLETTADAVEDATDPQSNGPSPGN
ncbi:cupin domain protein [Halalkalicoccus paucihalophilus]|uniref:Cupin domain protein n=1 Tax=Halalkalicoccus paucihalophilus TaxID=1008153 RepID=A0A151ACT8_9EURY|nr:cupin domain-containing protein [Halalkalicoccus paucihalophilus]KYH25449.1 cupin domain protein [Halalkalicoccus paucihalophilus]